MASAEAGGRPQRYLFVKAKYLCRPSRTKLLNLFHPAACFCFFIFPPKLLEVMRLVTHLRHGAKCNLGNGLVPNREKGDDHSTPCRRPSRPPAHLPSWPSARLNEFLPRSTHRQTRTHETCEGRSHGGGIFPLAIAFPMSCHQLHYIDMPFHRFLCRPIRLLATKLIIHALIYDPIFGSAGSL